MKLADTKAASTEATCRATRAVSGVAATPETSEMRPKLAELSPSQAAMPFSSTM
jgi:hypothetical protein